MILRRHSRRYREELWNACAGPGSGKVFCNLCGLPIHPGEEWVESHIGAPKALGGTEVGCAHKRCNDLDNNHFVTPFVAKAKRLWRKHFGISARGLGANPLPAGRHSKVRKKLTGEIIERQSQIELHHATLTKRYPR